MHLYEYAELMDLFGHTFTRLDAEHMDFSNNFQCHAQPFDIGLQIYICINIYIWMYIYMIYMLTHVTYMYMYLLFMNFSNSFQCNA